LAACDQHAPAAGGALDANVGAQPEHVPLISTAGVGFAQANDIADTDFYGHRRQLLLFVAECSVNSSGRWLL
jgi:hypothetical protein